MDIIKEDHAVKEETRIIRRPKVYMHSCPFGNRL